MARYVKGACDTFVSELQENVRKAKIMLQQKFEVLDFKNAEEKRVFESYYDNLIDELERYSAKVGSYEFLSS